MTDLRDRPNPSRWSGLLARALPLVDHVYGGKDIDTDKAAWTLGGGTAIALRITHRISDDVDLFVDTMDLRAFIPMRNPHARGLSDDMQFPGNYLKFLLQDGEIDFLPGPLISNPGYTWETFGGRRVALQTSEEVILKKVRYRSGSFKARDAFDLAAVARLSEHLGTLLVDETGDMLPTLLTALGRHDGTTMAKANIRPLAGYENLASTAVAESTAFITDLIATMEKSR